MNKHFHFYVGILVLSFVFLFASCSNLFLNVLNGNGELKTGDDSLLAYEQGGSELTSGLAVIKASDKEHNQIHYVNGQTEYFVGKVPDSYASVESVSVNYSNGTETTLLGIDDPVEFRCFNNDKNAKIEWSAVQTWEYVPETKVVTRTDADGNKVKYTGISGQTANKLEVQKNVPLVSITSVSGNYVKSDLPYGVTVVTCKIIADDEQYFTEYKIILTKEYICTHAQAEDPSNVTDHGLIVIKASAPEKNAIAYSSTTYEYEVGDSTGNDKSVDLTGRDDPVIFKCYLLDKKAELSWSAVQTKEFVPVWDANKTGIISQSLKALDTPVEFAFIKADENVPDSSKPFMQYVNAAENNVLKSDLPYGVTEVTAKITAQNEDENGELVTFETEYKIKLTKRYIITAGRENLQVENVNTSGLSVYANTAESLISYSPTVLNYTVDNLTGANDPAVIKYIPEESVFTNIEWKAVQTHAYNASFSEITTAGGVTYTIQKSGKFEELSTKTDLIAEKILAVSTEGEINLCTGNLPYGITVVSVKASSTAEKTSTTYTITLKKKRIATQINIVSGDENLSTVTESGLVALSAKDDYSINHIAYKAAVKDYTLNVTQKDNGTNGMKFRCYPADSEANLTWSVIQTKEFTPVYTSKTETDDFTGQTKTVKYISGQNENAVSKEVSFVKTAGAEGNEITATIPYGVTKVMATISSANEATNVYTITLTRKLYDASAAVSGDDDSGGTASLLKELKVEIKSGSQKSNAVLEPDFTPTTKTYTLKVDETADEITIDAIAEAVGAEISNLNVITKYGTVPAVNGMVTPLLGGSSRISFTVTDESTVSRTYSIYVEKPEDGDTSLSSFTYTPQSGYENGVDGFVFAAKDKYKGAEASAASKYAMLLEASSRVDVSNVQFTATPNNRRTKVSYGISDSETTLPVSWSSDFYKSDVKKYSVDITDGDAVNIVKYLWVRTVTDDYYHKLSTGGYETTKRSDVLYHKVKITKAGRLNTNLAEMYITAEYENLDNAGKNVTKNLISLPAQNKVGYTVPLEKTLNLNDGITTFADKLTFKFRPLDKDATVTYTAENTNHVVSENTEFTGYAKDPVQLSPAVYRDSEGYYSFSIGEIAGGTSSRKDLPNGTTKVTICGVTYLFVKPDLDTVSQKVTAGSGQGTVSKPWEFYIYLSNSVTSLEMNLTTTQQNETIEFDSCEQTAGVNGSVVSGTRQDAGCTLHHYNTASGENIVLWKLLVGNAAESVEYYNKIGELNTLATEIPVGTTTLRFTVYNNERRNHETYTYYIIREAATESRLKTLSLAGKTPSGFTSNLIAASDSTTFAYKCVNHYYNAKTKAYEEKFPLDAAEFKIAASAVSADASIKIEKSHSNKTVISEADAVNSITNSEYLWDNYSDVTNGTGIGSVEAKYQFTQADAGIVAFRVTVTSNSVDLSSSSSRQYYMFVYVQADKTAQIDNISIVQKGNNTDLSANRMDRTILGNAFAPKTTTYSDLYASLNYTGDIVVAATPYEKARLITDEQTGISRKKNGVVTNSLTSDEVELSADGKTFTIHADKYLEHLGESYDIVYKVQAQDETVEPVLYKLTVTIPEYTTVTETSTRINSSTYEYKVPASKDKALGYRFGSVFADTGSAAYLSGQFGGIDIIGSTEATNANAEWYESSFASSGLQFVIDVDGKIYGVELGSDGKSKGFYELNVNGKTSEKCTAANSPAVELTVHPTFVYEDETPYLNLNLSVANNTGKSVKLGGVIDTLVGKVADSTDVTNDSVNVVQTNNGFAMNGRGYYFAAILKNAYLVDAVDKIWYGPYDGANFINKVFDSAAVSGLSTGEDSSATFSWNLGSETSYTKTIRFTMGSGEYSH